MLIRKIKKLFISTLVIAAIVGNFNTYANNKDCTYNEEEIVIALDAGHYMGENTYKKDYNGIGEVEYNYEIVKRIKENIEKVRPDVKIYLTNPDKTNTGRSSRAEECKKNNVDFLISIHQDALGHEMQTSTNGTHAIVDQDSMENVTTYLASKIINDYSGDTGIPLRNNGVDNTRNNIGLLDKATELGIPSILIECGFYDNPTYNNLINSKEGMENVSNSISDSIIRHIITYLDKLHQNKPNPQNGFKK